MAGMKRDRRIERELAGDRRRSGRIPDYRSVEWRGDADRRLHKGLFVEWSAHGMAMLTEKLDTPTVGTRIAPLKRPDLRGWLKPVLVKRVDTLPGGMQLVVGEYVNAISDRAQPSWRRQVDRRGETRRCLGRRKSPRWPMDRELSWCVHRGRKTRQARIIERSLDGLVLLAGRDDTVPVGTRINPTTLNQKERLGFRSAVVRRTQALNDTAELLIVEIEA